MNITIKNRENRQIVCQEKQTILEACKEADLYLPALCAGRGTCGKCKIKILSGEITLASVDERSDSVKQQPKTTGDQVKQRNGHEFTRQAEVLACKAYPLSDLILELPSADEEEILVEGLGSYEQQPKTKLAKEQEERLFIGVDIGTTTIAMALAGEESGEVKDSFAGLNRQRMYGADVISRIAEANNGRLEELHSLIISDLSRGILALTKNGQLKVEKVVIAANTTMVHLLFGYSCRSLGQHPFSSAYLGLINSTLGQAAESVFSREELLEQGLDPELKVVVLPGISAFVGGDITSDLIICPGFLGKEICLLFDMGTNGEMVIGNQDRLIASSTAAGPAFEGGNITCGTGSIPGAINQVKIMNRRAVVGTIGGKQPAVGVCGTGIIDSIAQLKQNKLMELDGALKPPYDQTGFPLWAGAGGDKVAIYQQDIRQLQLAKGAIRAGMEQLMEAFGCTPQDVERVYLAGGFGTKLPIEAAIQIGLFPSEFRGKIESIGNGALMGAIAFGRKNQSFGQEEIENMITRTENLNLALAEGFEERYLRYLDFA